MLLVLVLDVVAVWGTAGLFAKRDMSEDWFRFVIFVLGLVIVGVIIMSAAIPALLAFFLHFAAVTAGMRYLVGATWVGALVGALIFVLYRVIVAVAMSAIISS